MADLELLTDTVSQLARTMADGSAVGDVLTDLAERITAVLGVAGAGVAIVESGEFRSVAASDERSAELERAQQEGQAGPGVDACLTGTIVRVADLPPATPGWNAYTRVAGAAGIVAVAAVPMRHDGAGIGAVDLYSSEPRDWSAADLRAAGVLADMATGYLVQARERDRQRLLIEQLQEALDSRIVIEQAKGVLAAERHISVDEAFGVLRRHARNRSVSLRAVAEAVVSLGLRP